MIHCYIQNGYHIVLDIYSGNDDEVLPILSIGGIGVISVLANVMPEETHNMVMDYLSGETARAADFQLKAIPLINALFSEVNPIPVKAAMAAMGWCENLVRLPLTPMEEEHWQKLRALMVGQGLLS